MFQAALTTAIAAGDSPVLADLSCNGIPLFASEGVLADMTPYIERDNFDMDNVVKELTDYVYYDKPSCNYALHKRYCNSLLQ